MTIRCCACSKDLGEKPPYDDRRVTHTYCEACEAQLVSALMHEVKQQNPRLA